eukprot:scaffold132302_cov15-Tisochrysis_lutea.AAC.1
MGGQLMSAPQVASALRLQLLCCLDEEGSFKKSAILGLADLNYFALCGLAGSYPQPSCHA